MGRYRWFFFAHPILGATPFRGAHLVDSTIAGSTARVDDIKPLCDAPGATIETSPIQEPTGFVLACCRCLGLSEVSNV